MSCNLEIWRAKSGKLKKYQLTQISLTLILGKIAASVCFSKSDKPDKLFTININLWCDVPLSNVCVERSFREEIRPARLADERFFAGVSSEINVLE